MKYGKWIAALAVMVMILGMTACGSDEDGQTSDTAGLKIAVCTSPNGVDDGSFNENVYEGIQAFIENNPTAAVTPVQETTGDVTAAVQKVADIVADYDVIVCAGFQFGGISTIAAENPDKKFILVDEFPAGDGTAENIYAIKFAEEESGFYAGMAAALETSTGKVAVVNGVAFPSNVNYQYGFECGVKYVNETEGKEVQMVETGSHNGIDVTNRDIGGNYIGDFNDIAKGKELGKALIGKGCDIIFVAAGESGNGVFTAAKEAGNVKVIGCDTDQYDLGVNGGSNVVLTTAVKVMDSNVEKALNSIADGSFKGGNYTMKADTDSTGYVKEEGRSQLSPDTVKKIDAAYEKVKDGTIVPASSSTEFTPDEFIAK